MLVQLAQLSSVQLLSSVQFSSVSQSCPTLFDPMDCSGPGFLSITDSQNLFKFVSFKSVMAFNHLVLCHPLLLLSSPSSLCFSPPLSMEFSMQEYWSGLLFPSPGNLSNSAIKPRPPTDSLPSEPPYKSFIRHRFGKYFIQSVIYFLSLLTFFHTQKLNFNKIYFFFLSWILLLVLCWQLTPVFWPGKSQG